MNEPVGSPHWYRVADLRPRLHAQVRVQRRPSRGGVWYVLEDTLSGRHHRINATAWRLAGRFDGQASVQQVWDAVRGLGDDAAPTQREVIVLLAQLDAAGLMQCERTPDVALLFRRADERRRAERRRAVNPLAFKVTLGDPSALLRRLDPLSRRLASRPVLLAWLACIGAAAVAAGLHAQEIVAFAAAHLTSPRHLFIAWVAYPVLKGLHELAHGMAVRAFGGTVHKVGITLMLALPVPFVDASASNGFPARRHRIAVAAAGIAAELLLAAVALAAWLLVEPGLVQDTAFVVMFVCGVSTLLFNGNPLLRMDGYFVLSDLLDRPNLAQRSQAYLLWLLQRHLLGLRARAAPVQGPGEVPWLVGYGLAAAAYRWLVAVMVVGWVAAQSVALGAVALLWAVVSLLLAPLWKLVQFLRHDGRLHRRRGRAVATAGGLATALVLLLVLVPVPQRTLAEGVVTAPEGAQLRAGTAGFVAEVLAADGDEVRMGQLLLRLEDPGLRAERIALSARADALEVERLQRLFTDPAQAQRLGTELARLQAELARVDSRIAALALHSPADGRLVLPRPQDLPLQYAAQGSLLGYVLDGRALSLRVPVPEADIDLLRRSPPTVSVRLSDAAPPLQGRALTAVALREVPAAAGQLPSAALGQAAGGRWPTDPADPDGLKTLSPAFVVDLQVPAAPAERIGARAWVRFDHGSAPLATQAWRRARQLLLRHFQAG